MEHYALALRDAEQRFQKASFTLGMLRCSAFSILTALRRKIANLEQDCWGEESPQACGGIVAAILTLLCGST